LTGLYCVVRHVVSLFGLDLDIEELDMMVFRICQTALPA